MKIDKDKLNEIAIPLDEQSRRRMDTRRADRYLYAASAAIAGKVIRRLNEIGMTRLQLAEKLGITPANITRYLNGKCNFELRTLVELERILEIHIIDRTVIPEKKENYIFNLQVKYKDNEPNKFKTFNPKGFKSFKLA